MKERNNAIEREVKRFIERKKIEQDVCYHDTLTRCPIDKTHRLLSWAFSYQLRNIERYESSSWRSEISNVPSIRKSNVFGRKMSQHTTYSSNLTLFFVGYDTDGSSRRLEADCKKVEAQRETLKKSTHTKFKQLADKSRASEALVRPALYLLSSSELFSFRTLSLQIWWRS